MKMRESSTQKIYDVHSSFYDATFGRLTRRRVSKAVSHLMAQDGQTVLDLGIGTGASVGYYPPGVNVIGVDLSGGMLRQCQDKINDRNLETIHLAQADALHLPFDDDMFDHVLISHVISVVSDPVAVIREAQRVAKLNARIIVLNHFQSTNRMVALLERWANPICAKLGWRSDLALAELIRWTGMDVDYRFKLRSLDLWETVVVRNTKSALHPQRGADRDRTLPVIDLDQEMAGDIVTA